MTVTEKQLKHIAWLAKERRYSLLGAKKWDMPGIEAALHRVAHLELADVTCAAMRAAVDRSIDTPAPIGDPRSSCWRERLLDRGRQFEVVTREDRCKTCSRSRSACAADPHGEHAFEPDFEVDPNPNLTGHAETARRSLRGDQAEHVHHFAPKADGQLHGKTRYRNRCACGESPPPTTPRADVRETGEGK